MGIARYSRKCPACDKYIFAGQEVAKQRVNRRIVWVHKECKESRDYKKSRLEKEIKQLDNDFKQTVEKRTE